jgi:site-specific DNA-methyltransferase (adenine-specific)
VKPYYADELVTLYHGDCREVTEWLSADALVTDPPYGRNWRQGEIKGSRASAPNSGIAGDATTAVRDDVLALWGDRPAIIFGDLMLPPPKGVKLTGIYRKPSDAGARGAIGGIRRDAEAIYFAGKWRSHLGGRSSIFTTSAPTVGGTMGIAARSGGHPHAKPIDVMCDLIEMTQGSIADPFAGSGATLVAAKLLDRRAIGVELKEEWCEAVAKRLSQDVLDFGEVS